MNRSALLFVFAMLATLGTARRVLAQTFPLETGPYAPFVAVNLDGGLALQSHGDGRRWLGAAAAGLGLYNGNHVWEATVGLRAVIHDRRELSVALARMGIENGLGFHAEGIWSFSDTAAGAGAGLSFSVLNAEGMVLFDSNRTKCLLLFLRLPVGLMIHVGHSRAP